MTKIWRYKSFKGKVKDRKNDTNWKKWNMSEKNKGKKENDIVI